MTTIATDGKVMAGDGRITSGNVIFGSKAVKVHRLSDGRIVGIAGNSQCSEPFRAWLEEGGDKPLLSENFEALVLYPNGKCRSFDEHCRSIKEELPTATGSGRELAIGAMEAGATPEQAVRIACRRDAGSGGRVTVLEVRK